MHSVSDWSFTSIADFSFRLSETEMRLFIKLLVGMDSTVGAPVGL